MQAKVIKEGLTANQVEGIVDTAISPVESQVSNLQSQVSSLMSSELHYVFDCRAVQENKNFTLSTINNEPLKFISISSIIDSGYREYRVEFASSFMYSDVYNANSDYEFYLYGDIFLSFINNYTIEIYNASQNRIFSTMLIS